MTAKYNIIYIMKMLMILLLDQFYIRPSYYMKIITVSVLLRGYYSLLLKCQLHHFNAFFLLPVLKEKRYTYSFFILTYLSSIP